MNTPILVSGISLSCLFLTSCDTPVGQGAAWGAATGAIIGGAATGHVRGASIGAAAGAAAGALTGAAIQQDQVARYGPPPPGGYPYARWAGTPGLYYSPYTGRGYRPAFPQTVIEEEAVAASLRPAALPTAKRLISNDT